MIKKNIYLCLYALFIVVMGTPSLKAMGSIFQAQGPAAAEAAPRNALIEATLAQIDAFATERLGAEEYAAAKARATEELREELTSGPLAKMPEALKNNVLPAIIKMQLIDKLNQSLNEFLENADKAELARIIHEFKTQYAPTEMSREQEADTARNNALLGHELKRRSPKDQSTIMGTLFLKSYPQAKEPNEYERMIALRAELEKYPVEARAEGEGAFGGGDAFDDFDDALTGTGRGGATASAAAAWRPPTISQDELIAELRTVNAEINYQLAPADMPNPELIAMLISRMGDVYFANHANLYELFVLISRIAAESSGDMSAIQRVLLQLHPAMVPILREPRFLSVYFSETLEQKLDRKKAFYKLIQLSEAPPREDY